MSNPRSTFAGAIWNHAGKLTEYTLMYLTSILIARGLGVEGNGEFAGLISLIQFFMVAVSAGLEVSLNTHLPKISGDLRTLQIRTILRRIGLVRTGITVSAALVIYFSLSFWGGYLPGTAREYFWMLAGYAAIRSFVGLAGVILVSELQTRTTSLINVLTRLAEFVGAVILLHSQGSAIDLIMLFLATGTAQLLAYLFAMRGMIFGKAGAYAVLPLVTFGGIYWLNNFVEYFLGRQGDVLLLSSLLPDRTQASLYDVSFTIAQLASLSMTLGLGGITLATAARLAQQSAGQLERFYDFMIRVKSILTIPLYAFLLFNSHAVLHLLYSDRFDAAGSIVQGIVAFRIVSRLFGGPENAEFLLSTGKVARLVGAGIVGAALNVIVNLLLIPKYGAFGAVFGSGLGNLAFSFIAVLLVMRESSVRLQPGFWAKIVLSSGAASLLCAWLFPAGDALQIIVMGCGYLILILAAGWLAKPLTVTDGEWLGEIDIRLGNLVRPFVHSAAVKDGAGNAIR
jgi:O-antigen/teichoic acid export membrane protein